MSKKALVLGAGLGGLATAVRLNTAGYEVTILEKNEKAGGRLNRLEKDGFTWDLGPTFFSMTYEFFEFLRETGIKNSFDFNELDPVYTVNFSDTGKSYTIYKDIARLANEFRDVEPDFEQKMEKLLQKTGRLFHDTQDIIVKKNIDSLWSYFVQLIKVPPRHIPLLFRSFWSEISRHFDSREAREIFSLVAFFLGGTPFNTSAVYTLLTYVELRHNGYHNVKGGMYGIVEFLLKELEARKVNVHYNTEITDYYDIGNGEVGFIDHSGKRWEAGTIVVNADAALFRGKILNRKAFRREKLEDLKWTMAPFTIYLGIDKKLNGLEQHNYFLGTNFKDYAQTIFSPKADLNKPYYYVNVPSKHNPESAPEGKESLYILCPVPHLLHRSDWNDREQFAGNIIRDLGKRIGEDLESLIVSKTIMTPLEWKDKFNLFEGSGLGLSHNLSQMAALRPGNVDEQFKNLYYVGASTVPGTGLPMVMISAKLVTEQIIRKNGSVPENIA